MKFILSIFIFFILKVSCGDIDKIHTSIFSSNFAGAHLAQLSTASRSFSQHFANWRALNKSVLAPYIRPVDALNIEASICDNDQLITILLITQPNTRMLYQMLLRAVFYRCLNNIDIINDAGLNFSKNADEDLKIGITTLAKVTGGSDALFDKLFSIGAQDIDFDMSFVRSELVRVCNNNIGVPLNGIDSLLCFRLTNELLTYLKRIDLVKLPFETKFFLVQNYLGVIRSNFTTYRRFIKQSKDLQQFAFERLPLSNKNSNYIWLIYVFETGNVDAFRNVMNKMIQKFGLDSVTPFLSFLGTFYNANNFPIIPTNDEELKWVGDLLEIYKVLPDYFQNAPDVVLTSIKHDCYFLFASFVKRIMNEQNFRPLKEMLDRQVTFEQLLGLRSNTEIKNRVLFYYSARNLFYQRDPYFAIQQQTKDSHIDSFLKAFIQSKGIQM